MSPIKERALYKVIEVAGKTFEIYYGPIDDPQQPELMIPYYPDFKENPVYTEDGYPFTDAFHDGCEHYISKKPEEPDRECSDCICFTQRVDDIGVCSCEARRLCCKKEPLNIRDIRIAICGKIPSAITLLQQEGVTNIHEYNHSLEMLGDIQDKKLEFHMVLVYAPLGDSIIDASYRMNVEEGRKDVPLWLVNEPMHLSSQILVKLKLRELTGKSRESQSG